MGLYAVGSNINFSYIKDYIMEKQIIEYLWQIIDDIDTASDMAKSNNIAYRNMVEQLQKKRWNTGITTDGYNLDLTEMMVPGKYKRE